MIISLKATLRKFYAVQKIKFSIKDFFSKCDQIRRKLRIWSYLLKKSLMQSLIFCVVSCKIIVLKIFSKLTGKHLYWTLIFNKIPSRRHIINIKLLIYFSSKLVTTLRNLIIKNSVPSNHENLVFYGIFSLKSWILKL